MSPVTVGVDLGGTNITVALVAEGHRVLDTGKAPTPTDGPDAVTRAVAELVGSLGGKPAAVGIGAPGPVREGIVLTAPNLAGWTEPYPLAERCGALVGRPVVVDNDANVGAVGEWRAGAGRGSRFLLGVWMGTGVGAGLVLDGKPYRGAFGGAGELGHMPVQHLGGAQCGCGRRGCVEAYAGRARMEDAVTTAAAGGRETAMIELQGDRPRLTSGVWAKALRRGDALTVEVFDDAVAAVGAGIGAAVNLLDLDRVVIGGGMAEKLGEDLVERVARAAARHILVDMSERSFVLAELGDDAGVVGAAALALDLVGSGEA